tara:strand:- start:1333 stop:3552 length:2220 start_codon:yes stop_codon:yes gene_type:complete
MSDAEEKDIPMAECGSCRAIIALDSKECPECGISFSGVSEEALGECGACNSLVPLDSKSCPECRVYFVADEVLDVLREWFTNTGIDAQVLFAKFDSDGDGSIDSEELREGLLKLNLADLPPSQIDRLISEVDDDNDGVISLEELVAAINGDDLPDESSSADSPKEYSENVVERIMKKFEITDKDEFLLYAKEFDENDNDYLTEAELKKAAESFTTIKDEEVTDEELLVDSDDSATVVEDAPSEESVEDVTEDDVTESEDEDASEEVTEETTADVAEGDEDNVDDQDDEMESSPEEYLSILFQAAKEQDLTIRTIFESMDIDDDGVIDGPELQSGINQIAGEYLSPGEIMSIISLVDKDSDGRVNALELVEIIESMDIELDSDRTKSPMTLLVEYMDVLDIDPGSFFKKLDMDGDGMINRSELIEAFANYSNEDVTKESIEELIDMFDDDGNESIDLLEFIETIETHEEVEHDEATALSKPIEFPSKWQKKMMSKRWKDVVWPLIHTGFVIFIIMWVVNGTLAPFVDGNGGTVPLDTEFGQTIGDDGTVYLNGDAYPCDDSIQIGGCKNSLTPFAGEGSSMSMPAKFYWDGVMFIILGTIGLLGSLFTQLSLVPTWRARVKAMRDNESEKEAVKEAVAAADEVENSNDEDVDGNDDIEEHISDAEDIETNVSEDDEDIDDIDYDEEDEIDIGSYIGLVLEDEEVFGTIIEFDDDEGLVTIEEDGTGDLVTGYQDDMFLED